MTFLINNLFSLKRDVYEKSDRIFYIFDRVSNSELLKKIKKINYLNQILNQSEMIIMIPNLGF